MKWEQKEEVKLTRSVEVCKNPWQHEPKCESTDILLYIQTKKGKGKKTEFNNLPICRDCWVKISKSNHEWGDAPRVPLKLGITEEDMSTLTVMDTSLIGHPKKGKEVVSSEDDEGCY